MSIDTSFTPEGAAARIRAIDRRERGTAVSVLGRIREVLPGRVEISNEAWGQRHRFIQIVLWIQLPALLAVGLIRGYGVAHVALESAPVAVFAVAGRLASTRALSTVLISIGLLTTDAVLVHFTGGLIEAHFTFFVMVPLIALYQDIRAFAIAVGFVLVQHTAMTVVDPKGVFNHHAAQANPVLWAAIHAGFVTALVVVVLVFWRFAEQSQLELAAMVDVFRGQASVADRQAAEAEQQANLARETATRRQSMLDVAVGFEASVRAVVASVASTSVEIESSARSLGALADDAFEQAASVASASDQASASVDTVAAASLQLSASIVEITRQVALSGSIASRAVVDAKATNSTVSGLAAAVGQIGHVVQLIDRIAGQTKLLALNATIEAARAGTAGKGFAVVAGEVQNLAAETALATGRISSQIDEIQGATVDAVRAIESIGGTIEEINEISATIAASVRAQGRATDEIARSVQQAALGTQQVSSNIGEVTRSSAHSSRAASHVTSAASDLSSQSSLLEAEVDRFLRTVRSA